MDVSPETVRQVEFREKLRGYHQDDVDEFLERMAAGLEILQERLREATERAIRAEQRARDTSEGEESLRRTLVLAQRTADLAVQEANEQASRIVESASAEAQAILARAEEEARRNAREIQSQAWADIGRLEAAREQLRQDVAALERYVEEERGKAQTALAEAARQLQKLLPDPSIPPRLHDLDLSGVRTWMTPPDRGSLPDASAPPEPSAFGEGRSPLEGESAAVALEERSLGGVDAVVEMVEEDEQETDLKQP